MQATADSHQKFMVQPCMKVHMIWVYHGISYSQVPGLDLKKSDWLVKPGPVTGKNRQTQRHMMFVSLGMTSIDVRAL